MLALTKGIPIVTSKWLEKSLETEKFLPTDPYLTIDKAAEKRFKFNLKKSLGNFAFIFLHIAKCNYCDFFFPEQNLLNENRFS